MRAYVCNDTNVCTCIYEKANRQLEVRLLRVSQNMSVEFGARAHIFVNTSALWECIAHDKYCCIPQEHARSLARSPESSRKQMHSIGKKNNTPPWTYIERLPTCQLSGGGKQENAQNLKKVATAAAAANRSFQKKRATARGVFVAIMSHNSPRPSSTWILCSSSLPSLGPPRTLPSARSTHERRKATETGVGDGVMTSCVSCDCAGRVTHGEVDEEKRREHMKTTLSKGVLTAACKRVRVHGDKRHGSRAERGIHRRSSRASCLSSLHCYLLPSSRPTERTQRNRDRLPKDSHLHRRREQHDHR